MHVNSVSVVIGTYLYFDCFLQNTATTITMATVAVITTRSTTMTAATITVTSVDGSVGESVGELVDGSVDGSVDGATDAEKQLSGSKLSITTGQVVSTCICVEATVM